MMMILRRQKKYGAKLEVIQRAIAAMEKAIAASQQAVNNRDPETAALSRQLAESLGLLDEDGWPVYEEPQLRSWRKRESVVEKRLESLKNKRKGRYQRSFESDR